LHWKEIALNKDKVPLDPDWSKYRSLMYYDMLQAFTARKDGKLIAYMFMNVSPHLHYKTTIYAINDILYVDNKFRKTTVAYRLLKFVEKQLIEQGVGVFIINMKLHSEFSHFLEGLGFTHTESLFSKYIGE